MIIYTYYNAVKKKRGTLKGATFYRDNTPLVFDRFIPLETDVVDQIEQKGCERIDFDLRDKRKFVVTIDEIKGCMVRNIGLKGEKRPQYLYDTESPDKRIKGQNEKQYEF